MLKSTVNFNKDSLMGSDNGKMKKKNMKEILKTTNFRDKENYFQMAKNILENLKIIYIMEKEFLNGKMDKNMKVIIATDSNMDWEKCIIRMDLLMKVNG